MNIDVFQWFQKSPRSYYDKAYEGLRDWLNNLGPYQDGSDRIPQLRERNGMVRLDVAIMAAHLVTADLAVHSFPALLDLLAKELEGKAEGAAESLALRGARSIGRSAQRSAQFLLFLDKFLGQMEPDVQAENKIRVTCARFKIQMLRGRLGAGKRRHRRRKSVVSRHYTPTVRKAHKRR